MLLYVSYYKSWLLYSKIQIKGEKHVLLNKGKQLKNILRLFFYYWVLTRLFIDVLENHYNCERQ